MSVKTREYVVQYRRTGARRWEDSHNESFPSRPSKALIKDEFGITACDLVHFPRASGSYEVRVIRREYVEKDTVLEGTNYKFSREEVEELVLGQLYAT